MGAPSIWVQILIALLGIGAIPVVITLLARIHLLPLAVSLLVVYGAPAWTGDHRTTAVVLLTLSVLYPLTVWGSKIFRWWQEEQYLRGKLMATAIPLNSEVDIG